MSQFFICNPDEIENKLLSLLELGTSDDGWTINYVDENRNENWVLTKHNAEYHGGGISILKRLPIPSISELINIALTSNDINDITGAAIELCEREKYNDEHYREDLINKLCEININPFGVVFHYVVPAANLLIGVFSHLVQALLLEPHIAGRQISYNLANYTRTYNFQFPCRSCCLQLR